jgi:hypothetical protein
LKGFGVRAVKACLQRLCVWVDSKASHPTPCVTLLRAWREIWAFQS